MLRDRFDRYDDIDGLVDDFVDAIDYAAAALSPPGNCDWARHNALQAQVDRLCNVPRACRREATGSRGAITGCRSASKRILRNALCATARRAINQQCYAGGDLGHRIAENQARIAGATCRARWNALGCGGRTLPGNVRRFV